MAEVDRLGPHNIAASCCSGTAMATRVPAVYLRRWARVQRLTDAIWIDWRLPWRA